MNDKLAKALVQAQAEMPIVPMNARNPFLKNRYADLGSVINTVRPVLAKHGLAFSQLPTGSGGEVGIKSILMHESGDFIESTITMPVDNEKGLKSAQVAGSIITYLRRYALSAMLGIYADEDTDGNQPVVKAATDSKSVPQQKATETFFAEVATSDDPPVLYKDLPIEDLQVRFNGLAKYLKRDDLEQDTRDMAELKRDAAEFFIKQKREEN